MATATAPRGELARLIREQEAEIKREKWLARHRPNPGAEAVELDTYASPDPGPEALAAAAETMLAMIESPPPLPRDSWDREIERRRRQPKPTVLLHLTDWSTVHETIPLDGSPCPVCRDAPLDTLVACLGCLRSGVDHLLEAVDEAELPATAPTADGLAGGLGKRTRRGSTKSRRRTRVGSTRAR
jgi:hypothetical protein